MVNEPFCGENNFNNSNENKKNNNDNNNSTAKFWKNVMHTPPPSHPSKESLHTAPTSVAAAIMPSKRVPVLLEHVPADGRHHQWAEAFLPSAMPRLA